MELFIKPVFAKESVDQFSRDVQKKLGGEGGASATGGLPGGEAVKEQKKQTGLLEQIGRFSKITAGIAAIAGVAALVPGAVNLGQSMVDTREGRLTRAFRGGENYDDNIADRIASGENLNDVLTHEMIIQEALDQLRRRATAELEGNTFAANDAIKTLNDLRSVYVDTGGTLEDFDSKLSSLSAKAWVDGDVTEAEIKKIIDYLPEVQTKIGEVASGFDDFANNTETSIKNVENNIDNLVGKHLDKMETSLMGLGTAFQSQPIIIQLKGMVGVLQEINDLLTDINKFSWRDLLSSAWRASAYGGYATAVGDRLNNKKSGDSLI